MMTKKYYVVLSGEHRSLPLAELKAIIDSEGIPSKELVRLDMVLILESTEELPIYVSRAALIKYFGEVIDVFEAAPDITTALRSINWSDILGNVGMYSVDMIRVKEYSKWVKYDAVLNTFKSLGLGKFIPYSKLDKIDSPTTVIDLVLSDGLLIIGRRLYERVYKDFRIRDPKYRPIYKPGTMKSIISRVFVNLSRVSVRRRELYLDPFCGVGGLLLEACSMGLRYCGSDIDTSSVNGAKLNLINFNCLPVVITADACKLPFKRVDGVGTDPPYGRLSKARARKWVRELMECSITCLADVIRKGGYLAIAQSYDVGLEDILESSGFKVLEKHYNWVHSSLTRNIYVAVKL